MENSGGNRNALVAILLFAVLIGLGVFGFVVVAQLNQVTGPVEAVSGELETQVAQLLNATPTILPDPVTIIRDVRTLARLETIQYSLEKVITAETGQGPFGVLFGDRLLFVAHGDVIAGVDLAKLQAGDMWVEGETLMVRLPEAEVFIAALDNDKSYVYDRDVGILTSGSVNLETEARQAAEDEILNAALEDGILDQARINAESFLLRLLIDLGYPDVEFVGPEDN
ncbi:MAG: DUF4230 domain-containing protein [Chloroflexi bacterium]|nr:MAG: DUF4230 domain-containing protein [Chloroflexota bacterium]MBL1195984.1 DUF4230 domain-containing protein [Chloroflexota bacterium]NOH13278.1 DUF4230 domain-containing protein [Chloroflexota bacterium]